MLQSYNQLLELVDAGVIRGVSTDSINAASIDITMGDTFLVEDGASHPEQRGIWGASAKNPGAPFPTVSLRDRIPPAMRKVVLKDDQPLVLLPGQFCLAQSQQTFFLPDNISAEYKLKSSMARMGLQHLLAGWCDAGWNGSVLTLEFKNVLEHHAIEIRIGDPAGQMIFMRHEKVPPSASYAHRGRYNGDQTVRGVKA